MIQHSLLLALLLSSCPSWCQTSVDQTSVTQQPIYIGKFSQNHLNDWESIEFEGKTIYELENDQGKVTLFSESQGTASGLIQKQTIDIEKTPYLNWSWKVITPLPLLNELKKEGDDYAARLYIIINEGWFFWETRALNFVWSSRKKPEKSWPNAFAPNNALMVPLRNANDATGQWYHEKVNIYQYLNNWLGHPVNEISAIAIMTDTDNSGLHAKAVYGDIFFNHD